MRKTCGRKDLLDDAYVGGILHDMGKIIFSSTHPELLDKITKFVKDREIRRNFIEDLAAGLNHAEIGGMIAEKWNFPEVLVEAIRYHHEPDQCSEENRGAVYTVYLANALCNIEEEQISYEHIEKKVLAFFGLKTEEQFMSIKERLEAAFEKEQEVE